MGASLAKRKKDPAPSVVTIRSRLTGESPAMPDLCTSFRACFSRMSAHNQRQHAFGQAGRVEAFALQEAREPLVVALERVVLGQGASHRRQVQASLIKAHAEGQVDEGGGEAGQVFAHGAAQEGKVSLHQRADDLVECWIPFHYC